MKILDLVLSLYNNSLAEPLSWRDGLVYTVGLTEGIKLHFQIAPFWRVRFRKDPFSWRISVNGTEAMQIKLCFQINPV